MRSHISSSFCISLVLLLLQGFNPCNGQTASANDLSSVKKVIEEKNQKYFLAIEKNDLKAFEEQFLEESWMMVPNAPVYCGPGAITDYFNEVLLKKGIARGKFISIDCYGISSEVVAEVGFYQLFDKANKQFDDGKYIVLWKNVNGQWKRFRETLSSSREGGI